MATKEKALVIVESPAKSKTIKKILGDGYQIEASYGHIRNLPTKDPSTDNLGFDVNDNFKMKFEIIPGKQQVVRKLNDLAKKAGKVYLQTLYPENPVLKAIIHQDRDAFLSQEKKSRF